MEEKNPSILTTFSKGLFQLRVRVYLVQKSWIMLKAEQKMQVYQKFMLTLHLQLS